MMEFFTVDNSKEAKQTIEDTISKGRCVCFCV